MELLDIRHYLFFRILVHVKNNHFFEYAGLTPDTVLILRSTILPSALQKLEKDLEGNIYLPCFWII